MISQLPHGFTARSGSFTDLPAVVDLLNAYDHHYLGYQGKTVNLVETEWKTPKFTPETDVHLVFTPGGELVGYIEVWMISTPPVHPWVWVRVHPDFHNQGIGSYLLNWGEARAIQAIQHCPEDARVTYRTGTVNTIQPHKKLFKDSGLKLIRHSFRMVIEFNGAPPKPVLPEGIIIRSGSGTEADIKTICRVDNEAFKDHFGFIEQPFEDELALFTNWLRNDESLKDPSLWFLAMNGDEAVGLALCTIWDHENRDFGHVASLGVLRSYRKQGIGLALLHHAFGEYYRRGKLGASLGVDAENLTGALQLYKKAGMHVHRQFDLFEKELRPGVEISVESLNAP
jgi:ribosomal protein S18 acetylase RimI-like enzyme